MRLLNTRIKKLEEFLDEEQRPEYAILSHTWGEEEILFKHMESRDLEALKQMKGYPKVASSCDRAIKDGYDYIWIDTCCIDKSSSAELSEAINSMWQWYRDSKVCYAYLVDAFKGDERSFAKSRWFTRGWTLQELIAPDELDFYDSDWNHIGSRLSEATRIAEITGIRRHVLVRNHRTGHTHDIGHVDKRCFTCGATTFIEDILRSTSVATKMSWGSERITTRIEDQSYCLLGLFGVNMPLLYGERDRAWFRLLEEIIRATRDQSILAFSYAPGERGRVSGGGIYAPLASTFEPNIEVSADHPDKAIGIVAGELVIDIWLCPLLHWEQPRGGRWEYYDDALIGILDCWVTGEPLTSPVILLRRLPNGKFERLPDYGFTKTGLQAEKPKLTRCRELIGERGLESLRRHFVGPILPYITYDISQATQQKISIVNSQSHGISKKVHRLQIMPVVQPPGLGYELDAVYPVGDHEHSGGHFIVTVANEIGMVAFRNNQSQLHFAVTWGFKWPSDALSKPGCKLWPLRGVDREDRYIMTCIFESELYRGFGSMKKEKLGADPTYQGAQDNLSLGNLRVQAEIRDSSILDRRILELHIRVDVVRGCGVPE